MKKAKKDVIEVRMMPYIDCMELLRHLKLKVKKQASGLIRVNNKYIYSPKSSKYQIIGGYKWYKSTSVWDFYKKVLEDS